MISCRFIIALSRALALAVARDRRRREGTWLGEKIEHWLTTSAASAGQSVKHI